MPRVTLATESNDDPDPRSLAARFPEVASEADGWDPSTVTPGSHKKLPWMCALGHRWAVSPNSRTGKRITRCPFCSGLLAIPGETDLATRFPEVAAEADGWDPTSVTGAAYKKLPWRCSAGHTWEATVANRTSAGSGCPYCSGRMAIPGETDLATRFPEVAAEADGWDPATVTAGSARRLSWRCAGGHTWIATPLNRTLAGSGCAYCSGRMAIPGETDLATRFPEVAAEADGWDPTSVTGAAYKRLPWRCALGHRWLATPGSRTTSGAGCPYCSGLLLLPGETDLATRFPEVAAEADGWDPATVKPGSKMKLPWKCANGHTWEAIPASRTRAAGGSGCPMCAPRGFDLEGDGFVYLVATPDRTLWKFGITGKPNQRFADHHREHGLSELLELWDVGLGHTAWAIERTIISELAAAGMVPALGREYLTGADVPASWSLAPWVLALCPDALPVEVD